MPIIETELLESFRAFAEALNFTRAARRVGLSQPAFFERIQRLSSTVGAPLYQRHGRTLALTPDGIRLLALAREIDGSFRSFFSELSGGPPARRVTLAAGEGSYLYLLGPAIAAFGPELDLLTLGARASLEALSRGEADLAVGVLDLVPRGIETLDLRSTPLCLAMPARHPLRKVRRLTTRHLRGQRLILTPDGQLHRDLVGRALASSGDSPRDVLEADGWPLMLKFVQLGMGLAVVNGICELPRGVVARPLPELGQVTYRLFKRRGAPRFADAERLERLIRAIFRAVET
jgi:DNA-binding transcriptional LysR family regulator